MDWQPAILASPEHVSKFHCINSPDVAAHAGKSVRVRVTNCVPPSIKAKFKLFLDCHAEQFLEVHPEDAEKLWPDDERGLRTTICACCILTD